MDVQEAGIPRALPGGGALAADALPQQDAPPLHRGRAYRAPRSSPRLRGAAPQKFAYHWKSNISVYFIQYQRDAKS